MAPPSPPDLAPLVPHSGPALLLGRLLHHEPDQLLCDAHIPANHPWVTAGMLPRWALVELMAQAAAALRGLELGHPAAGALAGINSLVFAGPRQLSCSETYRVQVEVLRAAPRMRAVRGQVTHPRWGLLCSGNLSVVES